MHWTYALYGLLAALIGVLQVVSPHPHPMDPCSQEPCANNGTCKPSIWNMRGFVCRCPPNYQGTLCQTKSACSSSNPCENGGSCIDVHSYHGDHWWEGFYPHFHDDDVDDTKDDDDDEDEVTDDDVSDFRCLCGRNYTGRRCEKESVCMRNSTCQNGAVCIPCSPHVIPRGFICRCKKGFYGQDCEKQSICVTNNPCQNGATCRYHGKSWWSGRNYTCFCPRGFFGENCQKESMCLKEKPCENGGRCVFHARGKGNYRCICPRGYRGSNCEKKPACMENPCQNGGSCIDLYGRHHGNRGGAWWHGHGGDFWRHISGMFGPHGHDDLDGGMDDYRCRCTNNYAGRHCEKESVCMRNSTCQNEGQCIPTNHHPRGFVCRCKRGFYGKDCKKPPACLNKNPCENGGTCRPGRRGRYACICPMMYYGQDCKLESPCMSGNPCVHGGKCHPLLSGRYYCECPDTHFGRNCEQERPCMSTNPCQHGGTCRPLPFGRYRCICPATHTGLTCQLESPCVPNNPCEHGGRCFADGVTTAYRCHCKRGYFGRKCEKAYACTKNPCRNGGRCLPCSLTGYCCVCPYNFYGKDCEKDKLPKTTKVPEPLEKPVKTVAASTTPPLKPTEPSLLDVCENHECVNSAVCRPFRLAQRRYICTCQVGYTGLNCQIKTKQREPLAAEPDDDVVDVSELSAAQ